jgi:hypothetical protein
MILLILDHPRYFKFIVTILLAITTVLCTLLVEHRHQTLELEKELARINYELYLKQVIHDQRMKQFEKEAKRHHLHVQQLKSEILSKLE